MRDHAGSWQQPLPMKPKLPAGLTREEQTSVTSRVNQLFETIRKMPEMAPPPGFQAMPRAFVSLQNADHSDGPRVAIKVNDLQPLMGSETEMQDDQGVFIRNPPEQAETVGGFPG